LLSVEIYVILYTVLSTIYGGCAPAEKLGCCFYKNSPYPSLRKGGCRMNVTFSDLIQLGILIVGIIGLVQQAYNKKK